MSVTDLQTPSLVIFALAMQLCPVAFGFQQDAPVNIVPRIKPKSGSRPQASTRVDEVRADLRVDVPLVQIPVHVATALGTSVSGLRKEHFRLFEDGVEQPITHFAKEDAPISVGLVFDSSGSMRNKMRVSGEAAASFFKTANSEDEFFLIEFNERPKLAVGFTRDSDEIYKRIVRAKPFGRTSLLDAVHLALLQMKNAQNLRKAVVILSDGGDNRSRYTANELESAMLESDVQVYSIGIFDPDYSKKHSPEENNGPHLLQQLAEETGGRHSPVENLGDLPEISARISNELRNQYVLGYAPTNTARDGKYRRVKVVLAPPADMPPLTTHHRAGYYAPAE